MSKCLVWLYLEFEDLCTAAAYRVYILYLFLESFFCWCWYRHHLCSYLCFFCILIVIVMLVGFGDLNLTDIFLEPDLFQQFTNLSWGLRCGNYIVDKKYILCGCWKLEDKCWNFLVFKVKAAAIHFCVYTKMF